MRNLMLYYICIEITSPGFYIPATYNVRYFSEFEPPLSFT